MVTHASNRSRVWNLVHSIEATVVRSSEFHLRIAPRGVRKKLELDLAAATVVRNDSGAGYSLMARSGSLPDERVRDGEVYHGQTANLRAL